MSDLQCEISGMREYELRRGLQALLELMNNVPQDGVVEPEMADQAIALWQKHVAEARRRVEEANRLERNVHIVFGMSDAGTIKVHLSNQNMGRDNKVLAFDDWFSIGPLAQLDRSEGLLARMQWKYDKLVDHLAMQSSNHANQIEQMSETIVRLPESQKIYIWCADNAHDQLGLRFVLYMLGESKHAVTILNITQMAQSLPGYEEGISLPYAIGQLEQAQKAGMIRLFEQQTAITGLERKRYADEWREWSEQPSVLRIWENGTVKHLAVDALDDQLLAALRRQTELGKADEHGFVQAGLVIGDFLRRYSQFVCYSYLEYRIWSMISDGVLAFRGLPGAIHKYSIRV
jgi:CII-binding regulator of phage lambda lysogenization HflD